MVSNDTACLQAFQPYFIISVAAIKIPRNVSRKLLHYSAFLEEVCISLVMHNNIAGLPCLHGYGRDYGQIGLLNGGEAPCWTFKKTYSEAFYRFLV